MRLHTPLASKPGGAIPEGVLKTTFDQKPGSNMHKTITFPKESTTSFMKFVREGG
jgi:hypothetical protein